MLKSIRLITFDAMKTLISPACDIGAEYLKVASIYGVKADAKDDHILIDQLNASFARNFTKMSDNFPNYGRAADLTPVEWWCRLVVDTFADVGFDQDAERKKLRTTGAHLYRHFSRGNCWRLEEGAYHTLAELRQRQPETMLAILSNFDDRLETILRDLGVAHFFAHQFLSTQVGHAKPDLRIFEHALEVAQVKPEQYLHVGDDIERDYGPVIELGGRAILIDKKGTSNVDDKQFINSLPELLAL